MNLFIQAVITGVLVGGIYALVTLGLTLIFGVMDIGNAAQAAFAILAAYIVYWLSSLYHVDPFIGMILATGLLFVMGFYLYKYIVYKTSGLMAFALLYFLSIFLESTMVFVWGNTYRGIKVPYLSGSLQIYGYYIPLDRFIGFLMVSAVLAIIAYVLKYTYFGKAIRATMQNPYAAALMGINVDRIYQVTFGIGIALSGIAGVILGTIYSFYPSLQGVWIGLMFAIVVFGGMGSLSGTLIGSIIIGIISSLVATYVSSVWAPLVAYVILVLTLWIKPSGIKGRKI